ncbi:UvrD-helicase domain-containing protein [Halosimplex halophilum]|uniref:UvrD-helicase domain-containing protein n=1 Tax=Halosimplex halophilum TaxID=2559572 RepID=UPI00107F1EFA|nr:ATP-dependent DNA helicase [Halosimplex halophilum]
MLEPNPRQRDLIESLDGPHLVDAGAGTGKTFAVTRRYANILDSTAADPDDILLVTFTRNAAAEMRDRIVARTDYDLTQLQDAPISTFHAYAYQILRRYGHEAPTHLGLDERIPQSLDLVEDEVQERTRFRTFVSQFEDRHPEHEDVFAALSDPASLRSLIAELAAKGVIPTTDGWFRGSGALLNGDRDAFLEAFREANEPIEGANGYNQSDARKGIASRLDSEMGPYGPDAPAYDDIVDYPQVDEQWVATAFDEDRSALRSFVHDLYVEYLAFALGRNYLTQSLLLVLTFVLLCEDDRARAEVRHEYVMIDEFQDTNELQFKLALLLSGTDNICVVGDWKQSIYGFQYTTVENIQRFGERIDRYRAALNRDRERVPYEVGDIERISLTENYRSTASVLEFAEDSLTIPATDGEDLDVEAIEAEMTELDATNHVDNSRIELVTHERELELVLDRVQHVVDNPDYAVEKHDEPTVEDDASEEAKAEAERARLDTPDYGDIAVFTRKRAFARDLIEAAEDHDVPVGYEGGIELFDTDQAKLLLAWLRIVESDDDRGWAVVLEEAGYTLAHAEELLDSGAYPEAMVTFREELRATETLGGLVRRVFDRYGFDGPYADGLVEELTNLHGTTVYTRGEAIEFLEANLDAGTTPEIDANPGEDAVTLQTIHSAKGLEYPIVVLANLNERAFPHYGHPDASRIRFDDTVGLRQTQVLDTSLDRPHVFDSWQYDVLSGALPSSYDEERRLLYVAMTRAKRHLLCTAGDEPSNFFTELDREPTTVDPEVTPVERDPPTETGLSVSPPSREGPVQAGVHDIMDDSVYEEITEGEGTEFGTAVHDFAEAYALGEDVDPSGPGEDEQAGIAAFIDELSGTLSPEQTVICPLDGDPRIVLSGIVDLLHVTPERVDIVDYKTDRQRVAHAEYRTQLSVYHHVLSAEYPRREIRPIIYYTADDERVEIEPLSEAELRECAERALLL